MKARFILVCCLLAAARLPAEEFFPAPDWNDEPNPLASPSATPGGTITVVASQYPQSFNYYLDNNVFNSRLFGLLFGTLLSTDPLTAEFTPGLARRWSISEDKKTFTFWLDERARWSDGRPVTAEDVRWTFNAVMDPANRTGPHKVSLQRFDPPEVVEPLVIRFHAKEVHWRNLLNAGAFEILPSHVFQGQDFNKINFEFPVVCGPYRLGEVKEGVYARLERREDWWSRSLPGSRGMLNFQTLDFRFFAEQENAFEAFKKGEMDIFPIYTARIWVNETKGEKFDRNWIVKQKVYNYNPIGFQGFAMNTRRAPFDDLRVRKALAHLLDRDKMNRTLMYNEYFLHRSYWEDLYGPDHPCENPVFDFDKDRARELLAEAGWRANPARARMALFGRLATAVTAVLVILALLRVLVSRRAAVARLAPAVALVLAAALVYTLAARWKREGALAGLLEKDGKPFEINFLTRSASSDKFLAIYREDLKDVGIALNIIRKDWAAWSKDMDEFNYDMTWAAWSSGLFKDAESMWSSKEAARSGGNNITGFTHPRVDELIEQAKSEFDIRKRHDILRDIDRIITAECPYVLLWNINCTRLLYWDKFGTPPTVLSKFGDEMSALSLWWFDPDSAADLDQAMKTGQHLPARAPVVNFDEVFKP